MKPLTEMSKDELIEQYWLAWNAMIAEQARAERAEARLRNLGLRAPLVPFVKRFARKLRRDRMTSIAAGRAAA